MADYHLSQRPGLFRYLLLAHYLLINVLAIGLIVAAYMQGWLDPIIDAHFVELSIGIALVFLYGLALATFKVWQTSRQLSDVLDGLPRAGTPSAVYLDAASETTSEDSAPAQVLRLVLTNRVVVVRQFANALVFLGLIGTVIGFIIALSGVDPDAASDAAKVGGMVATLINGMSVALNTTLVGSVLYVWLIVNYRVLATGTIRLLTATLALTPKGAGGFGGTRV